MSNGKKESKSLVGAVALKVHKVGWGDGSTCEVLDMTGGGFEFHPCGCGQASAYEHSSGEVTTGGAPGLAASQSSYRGKLPI